ncbi:MAG TPA: DUF2184 domain-containing protein, partial [Chloroflexota bacterium]|nr:DUF2184 domain-containing protein [Chloroflexota bacterium]
QDTPVVLALPPGLSIYLTNTNMYNVNVTDLLKKNFPNIRCETAPQYASNGINTIQMVAESIDGQETGYCSFTEKMRAHPIVTELSAFKQKKSQGTWGAVLFLPVAFATMVGV